MTPLRQPATSGVDGSDVGIWPETQHGERIVAGVAPSRHETHGIQIGGVRVAADIGTYP
jgi:hypothetical protein